MSQNISVLGRLAGLSYRHAYWVLALTLLLGFISLWFAKKLSIDADLAALLPDTFVSVQDLELAKQQFGGFGYVVIIASGNDPVQLKKFADEITPRLSSIEEIQFVTNKRTNDFFEDRALYYLQTQDLNTIFNRVNDRWRWEKRQRNPLFIDLENETPPSIDFSDMRDKFFTNATADWMSIQQAHDLYYFSDDHKKIAVFIKPQSKVINLDYSRKLIEAVQDVVSAVPLSTYAINEVELTGRYKKQIDLQAQVQKDLAKASLIALTLVVAYLLLHFRKITALVHITLPLFIGILWTLAVAYFIFEQLNVITSFIGVILLGLGIDHGIHLYSRYRVELDRSHDHKMTVMRTFSSTGRAVTLAALTTLTSFIALAISDFRAFHEFGVIAAIGMSFILVAYAICLPALLRVLAFKPEVPRLTRKNRSLVSRYAHYLQQRRNVVIPAGFFVALIFLIPMKDVSFNYDFESLSSGDLESFLLDKEVNALLGHSQTPMIAMAQGRENEKYVMQQLRSKSEADNGIQFVLGLSDLVPEEQEEKARIIAGIRKVVNKISPENLASEDAANFQRLKRQVLVSEFDQQDLPPEVGALFGLNKSGTQVSDQSSIVVSPAVSLSDGQAVRDLARELREIHQVDGSRLPIAGETMILADILEQIFSESPKIFLFGAIVIFGMLWIGLKRFRYAFLCFGFSLLTLAMTIGVMSLLGIKLNYINILILPVLLGLSVDSGVHLITRAIEGDDLARLLSDTGVAISGSALTSIFGMLGLVLADHQGLSSLGWVSVIGLIINIVLSFTLMAALLPRQSLASAK